MFLAATSQVRHIRRVGSARVPERAEALSDTQDGVAAPGLALPWYFVVARHLVGQPSMARVSVVVDNCANFLFCQDIPRSLVKITMSLLTDQDQRHNLWAKEWLPEAD